MYRLVVLFLLAASVASGQTISSVSGTVSHGTSITISGSGFGTKSPAAPLRYENFEDGTLGETIKDQADGGFYRWGNAGYPRYDNSVQRIAGEMCALQDYSTASNQTIGLREMDVDTLYISGWTYRDDYNGTAQYCENVKFWGNWTALDASGVGTYPQSRLDAYWATNSGHLYALTEGAGRAADLGVGTRMYLNEWFRLERYMALGDPGTATGVSWASYNGDRFGEITGTFWLGTGDPYTYWLIGQYFRKDPYDNPSLPVPHIMVYWGELYADNTLARVELGNNPVFDLCTHREIQIPSAWSSTSVTATVNAGTFSSGESVYVFVVDADGTASAGYPVTIGGQSGNPSAPGRPQNMTAVEN